MIVLQFQQSLVAARRAKASSSEGQRAKGEGQRAKGKGQRQVHQKGTANDSPLSINNRNAYKKDDDKLDKPTVLALRSVCRMLGLF